ncbi:c-type cytochrome [Sphingobacterium sp. LRF_L2]|uniref:c-type cytochrome n=1 Tax=Sphingobacterium sp. LRF_L2 TaxID=3369421 RepID=UPI003F605DBA
MRNKIICLLFFAGLIIAFIGACQPNLSIETAQYAVNGQKLYLAHCQNCHGSKGEGLGQLYPALTDTSFLTKQRSSLACIVKNGLEGPIEIHGKIFDGSMPGIPQLTSVEIAYILTYVTTTFGNSTETYTQEEVQKSLESCKK